MVHGLKLDPTTQRATYVNRWVRTPVFEKERSAGQSDPGALELTLKGGRANTALVFHNNQLLVLEEAHLPMVLEVRRDGDIVTRGFQDFGGKLKHPFTAHPKVDPRTGEMIFFGYQIMRQPFCNYSVVDRSGVKSPTVPISYDKPVMIHDCAMTSSYSIINVFPLVFEMEEAMKGSAMPFVFNRQRSSRFAVVPRHATKTEEVIWFEDPVASFGFHTGNAWEDDGGQTLHVVMISQTDFDLSLHKEIDAEHSARLLRYSFHLPTRTLSKTTVLDRRCEFPVFNPLYTAQKSTIAWVVDGYDKREPLALPRFDAWKKSMDVDAGSPPLGWALTKVDILAGRELGRVVFGNDRFAGECIAVPKVGATQEDAVYIMGLVTDMSKDKAEFHIYDGQSMSATPVCVVELPVRVPFGFHTLWLGEDNLQKQASWQSPGSEGPREPLHTSPVADAWQRARL